MPVRSVLTSPTCSWRGVSVIGWAVDSRELELGNPRRTCLHLPSQIPPATCCKWPTDFSTAFYHLGMQKSSKVNRNKGGWKNNIQAHHVFFARETSLQLFSVQSQTKVSCYPYFKIVLQKFYKDFPHWSLGVANSG